MDIIQQLRIALFLSLVFLFRVESVYCSPLIGQDYLALSHPKFDAKEAIKYLPDNPAIGMLDSTFGVKDSSLRLLLINRPPSFLRVHILNTTCVRNKNCGSYESVRGYTISTLDQAIRNKNKRLLAAYKERVKIYRDLSTSCSTTSFLLSPALEHNLSKKAWRVLADATHDVWPEVQLVNSPEGRGAAERYKGAWVERHGSNPGKDADITSPDGEEATDFNSVKYKKLIESLPRLKIVLLWSRGFNCRTQGEFLDPRKRTACPSPSTFELMAHLLDERGAPPKFTGEQCPRIVPFKSPMILKTLAENKNDGDKRADLPALIGDLGKDTVRVLASNGRDAGTLGYYGSFSGSKSLKRYYSGYSGGSGSGGYAFEKKARELSGSPYVFIKGEKVCTGPLLTGIRQGSFR